MIKLETPLKMRNLRPTRPGHDELFEGVGLDRVWDLVCRGTLCTGDEVTFTVEVPFAAVYNNAFVMVTCVNPDGTFVTRNHWPEYAVRYEILRPYALSGVVQAVMRGGRKQGWNDDPGTA